MAKKRKERQGMILYFDHLQEVCESLTPQQQGHLLCALYAHATGGADTPALDMQTGILFRIMKRAMDRDIEKYEEACERNSERAKKSREKTKAEQCAPVSTEGAAAADDIRDEEAYAAADDTGDDIRDEEAYAAADDTDEIQGDDAQVGAQDEGCGGPDADAQDDAYIGNAAGVCNAGDVREAGGVCDVRHSGEVREVRELRELRSPAANRTEPNQTEPNQTEPNQTEQNQTKQNRTKPWRAAGANPSALMGRRGTDGGLRQAAGQTCAPGAAKGRRMTEIDDGIPWL